MRFTTDAEYISHGTEEPTPPKQGFVKLFYKNGKWQTKFADNQVEVMSPRFFISKEETPTVPDGADSTNPFIKYVMKLDGSVVPYIWEPDLV